MMNPETPNTTENPGIAVPSPVLVEKGEDPSVLVIAFTGFKGGLTMAAFDFLAVTKLSKYSRILLLDTSRTCYLGGVPPVLNNFAAVRDFLREKIAELAPKKIIAIGASSGAFATILLGHELKVDYLHAFSPYTYVDVANVEKYQDPDGYGRQAEAFARIQALPPDVHPLFDLRPILMQHNGKTRYYIHVCRNSQWDMHRAKHIKDCPGVLVIGYPCDSHGVAVTLARNDLLTDILLIENQEHVGQAIKKKITTAE